jgi:hypothetical protein
VSECGTVHRLKEATVQSADDSRMGGRDRKGAWNKICMCVNATLTLTLVASSTGAEAAARRLEAVPGSRAPV